MMMTKPIKDILVNLFDIYYGRSCVLFVFIELIFSQNIKYKYILSYVI